MTFAHSQHRVAFLATLMLATCLAFVADARAAGEDCPPIHVRPGTPDKPPVYVSRDSVSCRIFSVQLSYDQATGLYEFWTAEGSLADLQHLADLGFQIAFNYRAMTTAPVRVIEYFNRHLVHYFIAAEGEETAALDTGWGGPGWERTGLTFTGWKLDAAIDQSISVNVCRFYGSPILGPNSHFFTTEGSECELLKRVAAQTPPGQPKWNYEGSAFRVETAHRGQCRQGQLRVLRLYNNGFARGIDSNHRYTTRVDVAQTMVDAGWTLEGTAFCVYP